MEGLDSTSSPAPTSDVQEGASNEAGKQEEGHLSMEERAIVDPKHVEIECRLEVQGQVKTTSYFSFI